MSIRRIHSGGEFENKIGYCRAVVAGGLIHMSGTVCGFDDDTGEETLDIAIQTKSILKIIGATLAKEGVGFAQIVRVKYYLQDRTEFPTVWPVLRETFGENPPAATMIECGLIDPRFRIEIEVTALAA